MTALLSDVQFDVEYCGKVLRLEREAQGLSLEEVAFRTGLSSSYVAKIERGKGDCRVKGILRIARALGVSNSDLLPPDGPSIYAEVLLGLRTRGLTFVESFKAMLDVMPDCLFRPRQ